MEDTLSTDNLSKCCNHIRINIASIMSMERINESFGTVISCKRYPILAGYISKFTTKEMDISLDKSYH